MTRRRLVLLIAILAGLALAWDLFARRPEQQLSARALIAGIHLYQRTLSPRIASVGVACRFQPTCSRYAEASIRRHGAFGGGWRSLVRLARCGPWTPPGTLDPI